MKSDAHTKQYLNSNFKNKKTVVISVNMKQDAIKKKPFDKIDHFCETYFPVVVPVKLQIELVQQTLYCLGNDGDKSTIVDDSSSSCGRDDCADDCQGNYDDDCKEDSGAGDKDDVHEQERCVQTLPESEIESYTDYASETVQSAYSDAKQTTILVDHTEQLKPDLNSKLVEIAESNTASEEEDGALLGRQSKKQKRRHQETKCTDQCLSEPDTILDSSFTTPFTTARKKQEYQFEHAAVLLERWICHTKKPKKAELKQISISPPPGCSCESCKRGLGIETAHAPLLCVRYCHRNPLSCGFLSQRSCDDALVTYCYKGDWTVREMRALLWFIRQFSHVKLALLRFCPEVQYIPVSG
jgi:hypothetical protein